MKILGRPDKAPDDHGRIAGSTIRSVANTALGNTVEVSASVESVQQPAVSGKGDYLYAGLQRSVADPANMLAKHTPDPAALQPGPRPDVAPSEIHNPHL